MVGAVAGGGLTSGLPWRWVFLINVPSRRLDHD
jgi:hypothetical protein